MGPAAAHDWGAVCGNKSAWNAAIQKIRRRRAIRGRILGRGINMSTVVDERKYTAEDLLTLRSADRYELRHGMLVERDMGTESNWLAARVLVLLGFFLERNPLGYLFGSETSYACFPNDPGHAPRPDVSFIRFG